MSTRIATNTAADVVRANLSHHQNDVSEEMERISSGKRINRASDDAAGLAIATNLDAQGRGLGQAARNANDGISFIQTAEGGLNEISSIIIRLRELSVQAASDTVSDNERGLLDKEYQQLIKEIDRIAQTTTFNGTNLINGEGRGYLRFQVGTMGGEENQIIFNSDGTNATADNLGVKGTSITERDSAVDSLPNLDQALKTISAHRAEMGALQSRMQSTVANLEMQAINYKSAQSIIEDTDIAQSTAKLATASIGQKAAIATLAQANSDAYLALRLIDR